MATARLTDEQIARVTTWVDDGADLNQIQDRLKNEMEIRLTFMETRFLLSDLGLTLRPAASDDDDDDDESEAAMGADIADSGEAGPAADDAEDNSLAEIGEAPGSRPAAATVVLTVDEITIPGAMASGKVTFSDGRTASWHLDQMGRLGLSGVERTYQPPETDVIAFQRELQKALRRAGY